MIERFPPAGRFRRAALLGFAVARETRRILRAHLEPGRLDPRGVTVVEVPFPDSAVVAAILDAAVAGFGTGASPPGPAPEAARQAVLRPVLRLAGPGPMVPRGRVGPIRMTGGRETYIIGWG